MELFNRSFFKTIDKNKVTIPSQYFPLTKIKKVRDISNENLTQNRAGVIVYTIKNGEIYFCLGTDYEFKSLTDFSGGVKLSDRNQISTALREFSEESLGVFGNFSENDIRNCIAIFSSSMLTIFIKINGSKSEYVKEFDVKFRKEANPELLNISWISRTDFFEKIFESDEDKIYYKVFNLLNQAYKDYGDFVYLL